MEHFLVTYGGQNATEFQATDCRRTGPSNTIVRCKSAPGYGDHLRVLVVVSGSSSGRAESTSAISYRRPLLERIVSVGGSGGNVQAGSTAVMASVGGETVHIQGTDFGPAGLELTAQYGVGGLYYCANCTVTEAIVQLTCTAAAGTGSNFEWLVLGRGPNPGSMCGHRCQLRLHLPTPHHLCRGKSKFRPQQVG